MDLANQIALAYRAFAAGSYAEAAERAKEILQTAPADPATLTLVGRLALLSGDPDVAHDIFQRVLETYPQNAALWLDLTQALRDVGRHREALEAAKRSVALDSLKPSSLIKLGEICLSLNEREQAGAAFRHALTLEPDSTAGLRGLCQAEEIKLESQVVQRMEALVHSSKLKTRDVADLHYTLAQLYRRAGHREQFIRNLFTANAMQRSFCADGRAEYKTVFDRLESAFTKEAFSTVVWADPIDHPVPIFVLGMPRSGTTLTEQLLAAHPDVAPAGELDYMRRSLRRAVERETGRLFPEGFEKISAPAWNSMARAYARRLDLIGKGSRYVTDKTPGNYHLLGLLRPLLPAGRIVHVARDPMDTCFSILQYPFDDRSPHTCDVSLLAYSYARYVRLMRRWEELFGEEFITIRYEDLVTAPSVHAKRLYEYCGLAWREEYLSMKDSGAPVRTFSAMQVRQPIYSSSVGAWRDYADALEPLRAALERELAACG